MKEKINVDEQYNYMYSVKMYKHYVVKAICINTKKNINSNTYIYNISYMKIGIQHKEVSARDEEHVWNKVKGYRHWTLYLDRRGRAKTLKKLLAICYRFRRQYNYFFNIKTVSIYIRVYENSTTLKLLNFEILKIFTRKFCGFRSI